MQPMRALPTIAAWLAATMASTIAFADTPRECALVPAPDVAALAPYRKSGPYAPGIRLLDAGKAAPADRKLTSAWEKVRRDLAAVFVTDTCAADRIRAVLARTVLARPPLAVPVEDRFFPPSVIVAAVAHARCVSGDLAGTADWLAGSAFQGGTTVRAVTAVFLAASKRPESGLAFLPESWIDPVSTLARAYALARSGRADEARRIRPPKPSDDAPATERTLDALLDARLAEVQ